MVPLRKSGDFWIKLFNVVVLRIVSFKHLMWVFFGGVNECVICGVLSHVHNKDQCQCKVIKWPWIYSTGFINPESDF